MWQQLIVNFTSVYALIGAKCAPHLNHSNMIVRLGKHLLAFLTNLRIVNKLDELPEGSRTFWYCDIHYFLRYFHNVI
jgi:hypothetical protein